MIIEADAFLFDLDGTLIDSLAVVERVWAQWAREQGLDPVEVVRNCHGRRSIDTIRMFAPHLLQPRANEEFIDREASDVEGIVEIPGAIRLLNSLPRDRWAIVTSGTPKLATVRMKAVGIPMPAVFVTGDLVEKGKPDPGGFLMAAERLKVPPHRCLVFEDAPAGVQAAKNAGMRVITVTATHEGPQEGPGLLRDYEGVHLLRENPLALRI